MARTYRRDSRGRFAGNGNTSASVRRALQARTGATRSTRRIKERPGNREAIRNTMSQSSMGRQKDAFARDFRPPGRKNRFALGTRRAPRITQSEFTASPQRVGTVSRSRAGREAQSGLRADLKVGKQSMASYRQEFRKGRRYAKA